MKTSIIIGMGIGNLYKTVLTNLGQNVVTVDRDPNKNADYLTVADALVEYQKFDTAHICTPNFTHLSIANEIAEYSDIVFIEKPGLKNKEEWSHLLKTFPRTRFMMVKNNQWRSNLLYLDKLAKGSTAISFRWINHNRVPNPGTWFTTKQYAFGGVSRDLLPHLLSLYVILNPSDYFTVKRGFEHSKRCWELSNLLDTDYGQVQPDGVYDVDDHVKLEFNLNDIKYEFVADWKGNSGDDIGIHFTLNDGSTTFYELGLCPEDAYQNMISSAMQNLKNDQFWITQQQQDEWIHSIIERLGVGV